jgi:DNA-binding transcriptional regulator GbsR (MarR family)
MTETTDIAKTQPASPPPGATLPPAVERFVLQWGDMGGKWGVNRSVSQIHALLYLSDRPMSAEEVADTLWLARSNVSNSIKELLAWNLIRRVPIKGERRDHFEAETDVWEIFTRIAAGRKEREIDPAVVALKSCVAEAQTDPTVNAVASARLKSMLEFVETMDRWSSEMLSVPRPKLASLLRLGARIVSLLPLGRAK